MQDERPSRQVIADNIAALMQSRPDLDSNIKLSKRTSLGTGTISRILNAQSAPTADTIEILAKTFEVEPWQLLVPTFTPKDPPALVPHHPEARELVSKLLDMIGRKH